MAGDRGLFVCAACGYAYRDEATAKACEKFCSEHHACSLEITKFAVSKLGTD